MTKKCTVTGCDKIHRANGFCKSHDRFNRLYGDPRARRQVQFHGLSLKERLLRHCKQTKTCWIWTGANDANGYGRLNVQNVPELAHRMSWVVHYGDIPDGMCVCHKCDNPSCINPEHLFIGTQADNVADMHGKNRAHKRALIGAEHGMAKLTEKDVLAIRASDRSGVALAQEYGVSTTQIYDILNRRSWRHLK